jgi:hypothetical protein
MTVTRWRPAAVAAVALAVLAGPATGISSADDFVGGAATFTFTYTNGGLPPEGCVATTYTVDGALTGALTLGGQVHSGTFDLSGSGGTWGACEAGSSGGYDFDVTVDGTTDGGAVSCSLSAVGVRQTQSTIFVSVGDCSLDGVPAAAVEVDFLGEMVAGPPGGGLVTTATSQAFAGAYVQSDRG